jgi:RimJ/RimL family protein N-acetyltransferase
MAKDQHPGSSVRCYTPPPMKIARRFWGRLVSQDRGASAPPDHASPPVGTEIRSGPSVRLRSHVPANLAAFQRWYADDEIARLLRHDQEPLNNVQSRGYFQTIILPLSAAGRAYAIHETSSDRLIGTAALTDFTEPAPGVRAALFRIVIGEKDRWGRGYGTEATRLVAEEAFETHGLTRVRLEVFRHNPRALAAYRRVGFQVVGEHTEWVGRQRFTLEIIEMALDRPGPAPPDGGDAPPPLPK